MNPNVVSTSELCRAIGINLSKGQIVSLGIIPALETGTGVYWDIADIPNILIAVAKSLYSMANTYSSKPTAPITSDGHQKRRVRMKIKPDCIVFRCHRAGKGKDGKQRRQITVDIGNKAARMANLRAGERVNISFNGENGIVIINRTAVGGQVLRRKTPSNLSTRKQIDECVSRLNFPCSCQVQDVTDGNIQVFMLRSRS